MAWVMTKDEILGIYTVEGVISKHWEIQKKRERETEGKEDRAMAEGVALSRPW